MSAKTFFKASSVLLILFVASRVLGFVREQVIAALLGTSAQSDAFVVAATIPFTFSTIIGVSAGNAFLPAYTARIQGRNGTYLASTVFYLIGAFVAVLTVLGYIFTPQVVDLLAPGFVGEARHLALLCTRIMLPSTFFLTMGFLAKSALNAHREFSVPAAAPVGQNLIFLALILPFGTMQGPGLAWCTLAGAVLFYLYNLPALRRFGIPLLPKLDLKDPDVIAVMRLTVPVIISTLAARGFVFVDRWFGSHLPEGSIAALNFANRVRELPYGLFVAVVSSVLFPALAAAASRRDMKQLRDRTAMGLRLVALVAYPSAAIMLILPEPLTRLLFERGAFDASATAATATALGFYSLSVVAMCAVSVLTCTFLSLGDAVLPLLFGLAGLGINIAADYLLVGAMRHTGLALGNTVGFFVTAILFLVFLSLRLPGFDWKKQSKDQLKILAATVVSTLGMRLIGGYAGLYTGAVTLPGLILGISLAVGAAGIIFIFMLVLFNIEETAFIRRRIIK